jgi:hypothetical protein
MGTTEVLVVRNQSILEYYPEISGPLCHCTEVDVVPNIEVMAGKPSPQQAVTQDILCILPTLQDYNPGSPS